EHDDRLDACREAEVARALNDSIGQEGGSREEGSCRRGDRRDAMCGTDAPAALRAGPLVKAVGEDVNVAERGRATAAAVYVDQVASLRHAQERDDARLIRARARRGAEQQSCGRSGEDCKQAALA